MNNKKWLLTKSIILPLLTGGVAGFITKNAMEEFDFGAVAK